MQKLVNAGLYPVNCLETPENITKIGHREEEAAKKNERLKERSERHEFNEGMVGSFLLRASRLSGSRRLVTVHLEQLTWEAVTLEVGQKNDQQLVISPWEM